VFRIVQEALTNTLKHARARHVDVFLRWRQDELEVEVSDDGRGPTTGDADGPGGDSGGHGLVGMRERMALYGGELVVGRRPGGGFRVQARVPLDGVAGAPGVARPPGVAGAPGVARPPGVPGAAGAPAHR
jgi:signal transduction histidine kinase